jgi:hypothetical protein
LVVEPPITGNPLESFVKESTSAEWSDEGSRLRDHGVFEEAAMAFKNAGDLYRAEFATAFCRQEVAFSIPESERRRREEAFLEAANAFEHCAKMALNRDDERSNYAAAARCYFDSNSNLSRKAVVRTLKLAEMFQKAASYCLDNSLVDSGVSLIKEHKEVIDSDTVEGIKQMARLRYLQLRKLE